jgi:hypothetical protein
MFVAMVWMVMHHIMSTCIHAAGRGRALNHRCTKSNACILSRMQVIKSKLENETVSWRQALQDAERKYHMLESKANDEGDALRREIRAQGLSIAALQEAAMAKATSHAASSEGSEEVS